MEQQKRKFCCYDYIKHLLADLLNGCPNAHKYVYGYCDLATNEHLVPDKPERGAELIIQHRVEQYVKITPA